MLVLDRDSYYKSQDHLSREERDLCNCDVPAALDHDLLLQHVQRLTEGQEVEKPCYFFRTHARAAKSEKVKAGGLVIVQGLFALWDPRLRALMSLKVFVDASPDVRFIRRLRREIEERGRIVASVITQYLKSVRPLHQQYVDPQRDHADLIVDTTDTLRETSLARIIRALRELHPDYSPQTPSAVARRALLSRDFRFDLTKLFENVLSAR
jgi:uridine kinase